MREATLRECNARCWLKVLVGRNVISDNLCRETKRDEITFAQSDSPGGRLMGKVAATPMYEVRNSSIHGQGVFALRRIPEGTRIIEYVGERISHEVADQRYNDDSEAHPHILLFIVDKDIVVDAGIGGNEARFINHSCDPNCEAEIDDGHIYIRAIKAIQPGAELTYDYRLTRPGRRRAAWKE